MSENETHDDGLNVRLAKWLGWRVERVQKPGFADFVEVWSPDGKKRGLTDNGRWSEWIHQSYLNRVLPDYEHDLNAGMSAVPPSAVSVWFALIGDKPVATIQYEKPNAMYPGDVLRDAVSAEGVDCAAALARALDAMRQQQEAGDE